MKSEAKKYRYKFNQNPGSFNNSEAYLKSSDHGDGVAAGFWGALHCLPYLVAKVPWLRGFIAGGATSVMFFPDSCEVAGYSVRAGLGNSLADWHIPTADDWGKWPEAGLIVSIGAGIEGATYVVTQGLAQPMRLRSSASFILSR